MNYEEMYRKVCSPPEWDISEKELRDLKMSMKLNLPTDYPVKFRRVVLRDGSFGDTDLVVPKDKEKSPYFVIRIDSRLPRSTQYTILLHEYAHALQWRGPVSETHRLSDHDHEWSAYLARLWDL